VVLAISISILYPAKEHCGPTKIDFSALPQTQHPAIGEPVSIAGSCVIGTFSC